MAKLSTKHFNMQNIGFGDFTGGLNLVKPAEMLQPNEMQEATNFEFSPDAGLFKVRAGLSLYQQFSAAVTDLFPLAGNDSFLVKAANTLYRITGGERTTIGTVVGDGPGSFIYWGDSSEVIMAFGGPLYIYNSDTDEFGQISSESSPQTVNTILHRDGRVAVIETGLDDIRYSGVGDPRQWVDNPEDASTAKSISVGYKDGCDMKAVGELAGELIVFKNPNGQPEHGRVYRVAGPAGNWTVSLHSTGNSAIGPKAVATLGDDLLFLTGEGLASLGTTPERSVGTLAWPGSKVNPKLKAGLGEDSRLWVVPSRGQAWVWDGKSSELWVFHYQIAGAWTKFTFTNPVKDAIMSSGRVFTAQYTNVMELSDTNNSDADGDIHAVWKPRAVVRRNQILTKMVMATYFASLTTQADLVIEGLRINLPPIDITEGEIAATDYDRAATDDDTLAVATTGVIRKRCQFVRWNITPRLEVTNGTFNLTSLILETAEV